MAEQKCSALQAGSCNAGVHWASYLAKIKVHLGQGLLLLLLLQLICFIPSRLTRSGWLVAFKPCLQKGTLLQVHGCGGVRVLAVPVGARGVRLEQFKSNSKVEKQSYRFRRRLLLYVCSR